MAQIHQPNFQIIYNASRLAGLFQSLDELHTAASEGRLQHVTPLTDTELIGWLQELIYTAEETILEIQENPMEPAVPHLRLVQRNQ
jgi:gluconate kinase